MALTATATRSLRRSVTGTLGMEDPIVVTVSPDKPNIIFATARYRSLEEIADPIINLLKKERTCMGRVILFCKQQEQCANFYLYMKVCLEAGFTEPPGAPDLPQYRLVDMYMSGTHTTVKEEIIQQFNSTTAPLRVLIATVAFGMGVNPPDVRYILHCGPPQDVEMYIQQVGRGG